MDFYKPQEKINYKLCLLLCLIISVMLCAAQVIGNTLLVLLVLIVFILFIIVYTFKKLTVPILLFFLPWSPLLKFSPGQISVYTIAFFAVCLVAFANNYKRMQLNYSIFTVLLLVITGFSKLISGYYLDKGYILFFIFLILFPVMTLECIDGYDYYIITIFFVFGIVSSSLLAKQIYVFPTIARFIDVFSWKEMGITRYSGFYGDSNFYSAHVAPALTAVLLLTVRTRKRKRILVLIASAVLLLYCGFIAASKSFIIIIVLVICLWLIVFLFTKNKISTKLMLVLSVFLVGLFVFSSSLFSDSLEVIMIRFGQGLDADTLTTGRNSLWKSYLNLFLDDPKVLFIGRGYTDINLNGRASHNTAIQMIYQFGIIGSVLLILWISTIVKYILRSVKMSVKHIPFITVLVIGTFALWMGLDVMFLDEFFLIIFFFLFGIRWIASSDFKVRNKVSNEEPMDG